MNKNLKSQAGFSLIELMVVVGIIGILASIAVPQFSKFQAKARQTEAKTSLASLYTAEKGYFSEYTAYQVDLVNIGFGVEGTRLRYDVGFPALANCTGGVGTGPAEVAGRNVGSGAASLTFWNATTPTALAAGSVCNSTAGAAVFTAQAYGNPNNSTTNCAANNCDVWQITQVKNLVNSTVGIF